MSTDSINADIGALTPEDIEFIRIYLINGRNGTRAAMEAFGLTYAQSANKASRMFNRPEVITVIERELKASMQRLQIDSDWVLREAVEVYQRCMQTTKILDRDGNPTGEYRFDAANSIKALNLIGAHINVKAFEGRQRVTFDVLIVERLRRARSRTGDNPEVLAELADAFDNDESEEVSFMEPPFSTSLEDTSTTINGELVEDADTIDEPVEECLNPAEQKQALLERLRCR